MIPVIIFYFEFYFTFLFLNFRSNSECMFMFNHQYTGQTPPAPTRGTAVKKQAADGDEEQEEQEAEEVNVMDLIPRTNISGLITETIISELNDKNWKV